MSEIQQLVEMVKSLSLRLARLEAQERPNQKLGTTSTPTFAQVTVDNLDFAEVTVDNLDVENNIVVGGTVDGVDVAAHKTAYDAHVAATGTAVHGLGTISTQAASAVAISGGSITGITDLAVADGGTGASTASGARTNLGLVIGTDVQAYDADLAAIAALAVTDGNIIVGNGSAWVAESGATARTSLGVGTGDSPQFTAVELGHATDTTIARVSAGLISVEGNTVTLNTATQTLTNKTLTTPTIASFVNANHTHQNAAGGGTLDHGLALTGLTDDDHTQYLLATGTRTGASSSSQTFTTGVIDSSLTASRLMASDGSKKLASVATLSSWIAGTSNQLTVTDDGDGSATLSLPQNIHTAATPTFARMTLSQTTGTAPLTISSTTVVSNLNADKADGYDFDQDVRTTGTPTFAQVTVDNLGLDGNVLSSTSGAVTVTPLAGQNFNVSLSGAGDFAVNTNDLYVDTSTGYVGVNTTIPAASVDIVVGGPGAVFRRYNGSPAVGFYRAEGSEASPTQVTSGGTVGAFAAYALDDTGAYRNVALIRYSNDGAITSTDSAGSLVFQTTPAGSVTALTRMTISSAGNVLIGTTTDSGGKLQIDQSSTTGAIPVLLLDQADLSEEFIEFTATVGAGNPLDTAALGAYYGRARVNVTGVGYKYIGLYDA